MLKNIVDFVRASSLEVGEPTSFEKRLAPQRPFVLVPLVQFFEFFLNIEVAGHILDVYLNRLRID